MDEKNEVKYQCKLCGKYCDEENMSAEHYPAKSVGNEDIVAVDMVKMLISLQSDGMWEKVIEGLHNAETFEKIAGDYFDEELAESIYPKGRTAKTLCKECNTFLGKYDEAYLKFFKLDGKPDKVKGFQRHTKYQIIKAIFAKFLSIPEASNEDFDFIDFIRDNNSMEYCGKWNLYFVRRDFNSDFLGLKDIGTGMLNFDEGVVYEFSDDKFIFNLMDFEKHSCFDMTNIFDILNKSYKVIEGVGKDGGYHVQILLSRLLSETID